MYNQVLFKEIKIKMDGLESWTTVFTREPLFNFKFTICQVWIRLCKSTSEGKPNQSIPVWSIPYLHVLEIIGVKCSIENKWTRSILQCWMAKLDLVHGQKTRNTQKEEQKHNSRIDGRSEALEEWASPDYMRQ